MICFTDFINTKPKRFDWGLPLKIFILFTFLFFTVPALHGCVTEQTKLWESHNENCWGTPNQEPEPHSPLWFFQQKDSVGKVCGH